MKRKTLITMVGTVGTMALLMAVSGCGQKSKAEQAAEYYQEEFGMTKEEAEQLANEFDDAGLYDLEETGNQKSESQKSDQQENTFKLFDVMPEIENSKIGDGIVQVNDVLLHDDGTMTLGEAIDKLKNSEDGNKLFYGCMGEEKEFAFDGLVDPRGSESLIVYYGDDYSDYTAELCSISVFNPSENMVEAKDAYVVKVIGTAYNKIEAPYAMNIFFAGNLNLGLYEDQLKESEYYGKNATLPRLTYDTVEEFLNNQNADEVTYSESEHRYTAICNEEMASGDYLQYKLMLEYDKQTKECRILFPLVFLIYRADDVFHYYKTIDEISADETHEVVQIAKEMVESEYDEKVTLKVLGAVDNLGRSDFFFEVTKENGEVEYRACEADSIQKLYNGSMNMNASVSRSSGTDLNEYIIDETYDVHSIEDLVPIYE